MKVAMLKKKFNEDSDESDTDPDEGQEDIINEASDEAEDFDENEEEQQRAGNNKTPKAKRKKLKSSDKASDNSRLVINKHAIVHSYLVFTLRYIYLIIIQTFI